VLPLLKDIRTVSLNVAFAVAKEARDSGLGIRLSDDELRELIKHSMWNPEYVPYRAKSED